MKKRKKILVVDDEAAVAVAMVHLLSRSGCCVEVAWKPEQTYSRAKVEDFDLIILDVQMPGMSGFEACEQLKADPDLRHIPVMFVSGSFSNENRRRAMELGAVDCIAKPFRPEDFLDRVMAHAGNKISDGLDALVRNDDSLETDFNAVVA